MIKLRDGEVVLEPGEFAVIPHLVERMPIAEDEACVLLFERKTTLNTGTITNQPPSPRWSESDPSVRGDVINKVSKLKRELDGEILVAASFQLWHTKRNVAGSGARCGRG